MYLCTTVMHPQNYFSFNIRWLIISFILFFLQKQDFKLNLTIFVHKLCPKSEEYISSFLQSKIYFFLILCFYLYSFFTELCAKKENTKIRLKLNFRHFFYVITMKNVLRSAFEHLAFRYITAGKSVIFYKENNNSHTTKILLGCTKNLNQNT